jgi:hypothetical protein
MFKQCINPFITSLPALFISLSLILSACSAPPEDNNKQEEEELKECFLNCDTVEVGKSMGCSDSYYKIIGEKFILKITPHTVLRFDSCQTIYLDSINGPDWAHLLLYMNPENIMSRPCEIPDNGVYDIPLKIIPASSGTLVMEHTHETKAGKRSQYTTILIKHVFFKDPETGEKIEVKNELIWKVRDPEAAGK